MPAPNMMMAPIICAFMTQRLVAQDAANVRAKDQASRDKLGERLENMINQWNAQFPTHVVTGKPYVPGEFV